MISNGTHELDRVRAQTPPELLQKIDARIEEQIRFYATQPPEVISRRIRELDEEWDIDRLLETSASGLAIGSLLLAMVNRKWLLITVAALGVLFQHSTKGWSVSAPCAVVRTRAIRIVIATV